MIPWFEPLMTGGEIDAVKAVLQSGYLNDGPVTRQFEQRVAAICERRFGVAVCNGTSAIALSLMACDIPAGSDVIVPAFTFIATANAVRLAGCNVVLADIEPGNFCLSAATVDAVRTAKTCAVIVVEVNGRHPNWAELSAYCRDADLTLITDSCEALGTGARHGRASALSFSPQKLITTGQGGMVVTNDLQVEKRLQQLKRQGMQHGGTGGDDNHPVLGFNFKFTDIQAAIGLEQLNSLSWRLEFCRQRNQWYSEALAIDGDNDFTLWTDLLTDHQLQLSLELEASGIGCRRFWKPLNEQRPYRFEKSFPVAKDVSNHGIWLPSACTLTRDDVGKIAEHIKEFLNGCQSRAA